MTLNRPSSKGEAACKARHAALGRAAWRNSSGFCRPTSTCAVVAVVESKSVSTGGRASHQSWIGRDETGAEPYGSIGCGMIGSTTPARRAPPIVEDRLIGDRRCQSPGRTHGQCSDCDHSAGSSSWRSQARCGDPAGTGSTLARGRSCTHRPSPARSASASQASPVSWRG